MKLFQKVALTTSKEAISRASFWHSVMVESQEMQYKLHLTWPVMECTGECGQLVILNRPFDNLPFRLDDFLVSYKTGRKTVHNQGTTKANTTSLVRSRLFRRPLD